MGRRRQAVTVDKPSNQVLQKIIQGSDVESAQLTVEWSERLARGLQSKNLKSSQIRNVFGQVRRIEMKWPIDEASEQARSAASSANRELILLKPKLEYQARRDLDKNREGPVKDLAEILIPAIDYVDGNRQNFQRFVDFFEAILAYHKAQGGS